MEYKFKKDCFSLIKQLVGIKLNFPVAPISNSEANVLMLQQRPLLGSMFSNKSFLETDEGFTFAFAQNSLQFILNRTYGQVVSMNNVCDTNKLIQLGNNVYTFYKDKKEVVDEGFMLFGVESTYAYEDGDLNFSEIMKTNKFPFHTKNINEYRMRCAYVENEMSYIVSIAEATKEQGAQRSRTTLVTIDINTGNDPDTLTSEDFEKVMAIARNLDSAKVSKLLNENFEA